MLCNICRRKLNDPQDPLSLDCGGNCAACQLTAELDVRDFLTALSIVNGVMEQTIKLAQEAEADDRS